MRTIQDARSAIGPWSPDPLRCARSVRASHGNACHLPDLESPDLGEQQVTGTAVNPTPGTMTAVVQHSGQSVFGWLTGALAEYAIAAADRMWLAPTKMTHSECAALPIAGAAALQAVELGSVAGRRVVVNGASGGVGHYAVQIAKAHGALWVAGVCSASNADFVRSLGADQLIEYGSEDFTSQRWDVIIDCVGNRSDSEIRRALVADGRWIVVGDENKEGLLGPLPRLMVRLLRWRIGSQSCHWFVQGEDARYLQELAALVDMGSVRSHLSETVTMEQVRAGYDRLESGRTVGKLAVDVAVARRVEPIKVIDRPGVPS